MATKVLTTFSIVGALLLNADLSAGKTQVPNCTLPDGFLIRQVAGDDLATNIFCMTNTDDGRTIVSGPGYIRELVDADDDGVFDQSILLADFPGSGAQGLSADGDDLLAVGDGGLWRLHRLLADSDAKQESSPPKRTKLLSISTEGEHHAHAIRRGPDGFWYLMAGNMTELDEPAGGFAAGPITQRRAGFILRMSPDFSSRQFVAHGFRNAYDFDFNAFGQLFAFDSDGERDISMPWYRPTRVFEILPCDDAGWVNKSWKRPSYYFDMPKTIGGAGRGSPTGVVCYDGGAFPAKYRGCVFAGDWTFGRIIACLRQPETDSYSPPIDFLSARNDFAFPVTDLVIDRDGSLLVSVGGRGTAGGVYRIGYEGTEGRIDLSRSAGGFQRMAFRGDLENQKRFVGAAVDILVNADAANREFFDWVKRRDINLQALGAEASDVRCELIMETTRHLENSNDDGSAAMIWLRLAQLAVGGAGGTEGMFSQLTAMSPIELPETDARLLQATLNKQLLQSDQKTQQQELARLMTLLRITDSEAASFFLSRIDADSPVDDDIFWLSCLALSDANRDEVINRKVADALLALNEKVDRQNRATDLHWTPLLTELATRLLKEHDGQDSSIADRLLAQNFGTLEHVYLFDAFPASQRKALADRVEAWMKLNPDRVGTDHVRILAESMTDERVELLRSFSGKIALRNEIILTLAPLHELQDRPLMVLGLKSLDPATVKAAAISLRRIAGELQSDVAIAAINAANRLGNELQDVSVRDQLILLLQTLTGQQFGYEIKQFDRRQSEAVEKWQQYIVSRWPDSSAEVVQTGDQTIAIDELEQRLASLDGDADSGRQMFERFQCAACHGQNSNHGPRLEGVTRRLNQHDLLVSIIDPDRQVSDRYRATLFETADGFLYRGSIVFESADGVTLREPTGKTVRLNRSEIIGRERSLRSMMPSGLLSGATDQQIADLLVYLKTL